MDGSRRVLARGNIKVCISDEDGDRQLDDTGGLHDVYREYVDPVEGDLGRRTLYGG